MQVASISGETFGAVQAVEHVDRVLNGILRIFDKPYLGVYALSSSSSTHWSS